jgi:hypothetical protein
MKIQKEQSLNPLARPRPLPIGQESGRCRFDLEIWDGWAGWQEFDSTATLPKDTNLQ